MCLGHVDVYFTLHSSQVIVWHFKLHMYTFLCYFILNVSEKGVGMFIINAIIIKHLMWLKCRFWFLEIINFDQVRYVLKAL